MSKAQPIIEKQAPFLAGQPAIDFLNTEWPNGSGGKEFFNTDEHVLLLLRKAGLAPEGVTVVRPSGSLLRAARALRSVIRTLVEGRKAGKTPDLSDLNAFLVAAQTHPQLAWTKAKVASVRAIQSLDTAQQILAPISLK